MAVGDESIGLGAKVEIDDGGSGGGTGLSFVEVGQLLAITPPAIKMGTAESKRINVARIRKIATIETGENFSYRVQFTNAGWARHEAIRSNKRRNTYRITIPDDAGNTIITVIGLIAENKTDSLEADKITEFEVMVEVAE